MVLVTFVMEQHLGLYTYYENLRRYVDAETDLEANWVPVTYRRPGGFWERAKLLPASVRGALIGRAQVRQGIARAADDILFFNTQVPAALAHGSIGRRPYIISTDVTPLQYDRIGGVYGHRADRAGPLKSFKHMVNVRVFRGACRILPWSRWVSDSLVDEYGVDPDRIEVIPPGIDLTQWRPGDHTASAGPVKVLFVGGEFERKGGPLLLEALRAVRSSDLELHLVTRDPLPPEPGLFVYNDMKPNSDRLMALYRTCDLLCLPTQGDCLPMVLLEAAASGLPAIATGVGAIPEVVLEGETGFLIEPGDVRGLIDRLQRLASDPELRRKMGRTARQHVEASFDARRNGARVVGHLLEFDRSTIV